MRADAGGDRSPFGSFWFEPAPFRGGSSNLSSDAAMQLTAVYACVRNASEDTATLPFSMYKIGTDGKKSSLTQHWLYRLFAKRPNAFQNPLEFREMMQGHLELRGNAFAEIVANRRGEVTDLMPLHPDRVTIEMLGDTHWRYVVKRHDGSSYRLARADMFHIKGLSSNGIIGYNPIQLARKAIATGIAAQDYGMRFFENDAKPGGWIEHPNQFPTDEKRNLWRDAWQAMQTGRNKHKTAVLEFGMKYHEIAVSNDDAQFIETKKYSVADIARMWRMPLHMIGDLDRSTNNNIEQQSLEYVIYSIRPRLIRWEEAIKATFLDIDDDTITIEFSVLALLRGDLKSRSAYIHSMVQDGVLTRNEAREMEGRDPIDGLDEPLRPLNMVQESEAEKPDTTTNDASKDSQ
jgi:HK97 family phage portal protein